jgi:hypothetical protein
MTSKASKLAAASRAAAEVRAYQTDPDVIALRVERVRGWVDRLVWSGIVAGLLFTMANVQHFAARGAKPPWQAGGSVEWVIAWLLDPMVSLVLIGVLMGEQIINRHQLTAGAWVRRTKWVALICTYAMNTWSAWAARDAALILLHSVPPVIVVCAAEAITTLRHQITEAVTIAYRLAAERAAALATQAGAKTTAPQADARTDETRTADRPADRAGSASQSTPQTRKARTDIARADTAADAPHSARPSVRRPGGSPNRKASGAADVDRLGLVAELADQIRDAVHAGEQWRPDYPALMQRTGFKRRWCEEVVRDAKLAVLSAGGGQESAQALDVRTPAPANEPPATAESAADADDRADDADTSVPTPSAPGEPLAMATTGGERS